MEDREREIDGILSQPVSLDALFALSRQPGGFLNSRIRQKVWPKLLGVSALDDWRVYIPPHSSYEGPSERDPATEEEKGVKEEASKPHRDAFQLKADIERSLWSIKQIEDWPDEYRDKKRIVLHDIILANLFKNTELYYYQGFHDIVSVFYLVLEDEHLTFAHTEVVSKLFLADYMREDFEVLLSSMRILLTIIELVDRPLYNFFMASNLQPYFATSWLITWFSHDDRDLDSVARIFDALLCSHPAFCFYISAAYIIGMRDSIFNVDCEFAELHNFLVHAPRDEGFEWEGTLALADRLLSKLPIHELLSKCDESVWQLIKENKVEDVCVYPCYTPLPYYPLYRLYPSKTPLLYYPLYHTDVIAQYKLMRIHPIPYQSPSPHYHCTTVSPIHTIHTMFIHTIHTIPTTSPLYTLYIRRYLFSPRRTYSRCTQTRTGSGSNICATPRKVSIYEGCNGRIRPLLLDIIYDTPCTIYDTPCTMQLLHFLTLSYLS